MTHNSISKEKKLRAQFTILAALREFFSKRSFIEVMPPPMVQNPGMETHIHPFQVAHAKTKLMSPWYLQTSPEFHMKELLSLGFENIFTLGYSFRDEPQATHHRPQFIMLEWYRSSAHYFQIMNDCEYLFKECLNYLEAKKISIDEKYHQASFERATIQDLFLDFLQIDILEYLDPKDLRQLIETKFKDVPLPQAHEKLAWDDLYFLLFLNKIEPHLSNYPYLLLYEFPFHLSALSTIKETDSRVCERFEIYAKGVEICNAFNELCDLKIQKERFLHQKSEKESLYHYSLPEPEVLYRSMERGLPASSGIALGVERFLRVLTDIENPFWD